MNQKVARICAALLADPDRHVILDTETTGLDGPAEIIQLAVITLDGITLLDTLIRPADGIPARASRIHGIYERHVASAPRFPEVYAQLVPLIEGKTIIVYNAPFDRARLAADCRRHDLPPLINMTSWRCAMQLYSEWYGEWNHYFGNYKWQPLPGGGHTALADCLATLKVLRRLATELETKPKARNP